MTREHAAPPWWREGATPDLSSSPAGNDVVEAEGLYRTFGDTNALTDISLTVRTGEVLALIGPSGSGKTTLAQLMVGLQKPTSGTFRVLGKEPASYSAKEKRQVGYVPQEFLLYPGLTVHQNLKFVAGIYGLGWLERRRRIRRALEQVELWDDRKKLARQISGGMKRRLALAGGLLHSPRLLVVDEPTAGLDPALRYRIWDFLLEMRDADTTLIVTTQNLDEAERCDRVGILQDSRLIALGTPRELSTRAIGGEVITVETQGFDTRVVEAIARMPGVVRVETFGIGGLRIVVDDAGVLSTRVLHELEQGNVTVGSMRTIDPSFDEVFLELVRQEAESNATADPHV